jgi:hypothetical protein
LAAKDNRMVIPFVPKEYSCHQYNGFRLWHAKDEDQTSIDLIFNTSAYALDQLFNRLRFKNKRKIEICLYHSNEQAVLSLDRRIPRNMAMAPYSTSAGSLIIVQNAITDPINGDLQRMRRILIHEICHLFVREKSKSTTFLGDGQKNMNVRPWIDEGFAEYLSWLCIGKRNPISQKRFEFIDDLDEVDRFLNDFNSNRRTLAFYTATCLVKSLIDEFGLINFFESMTKISETGYLPIG